MKVTAIFDIGKTNKKFFLFDKDYHEQYKEYIRFDPSQDDDGDACDNLEVIETWMKSTLRKCLKQPDWEIESLNFSSYGASLVHIGATGRPVAPLYNYLKSASDLSDEFYLGQAIHHTLEQETSSPALGFLNAGLQLYWLKHYKPKIFEKTHLSLHLPQYLSYIFSGRANSDFTSIGCHTALWDFRKKDYHQWVYQQKIDRKLPAIVSSEASHRASVFGKELNIGVGIHDSSAALLPYLKAVKQPFVLVSTGTWSITMNPFSQQDLTPDDLKHDCLHFLGIDGQPVRACRLFLGQEYSTQVQHLNNYFNKRHGAHRKVGFDAEIYAALKQRNAQVFRFQHITNQLQIGKTRWSLLGSFEEGMHQLVMELSSIQASCIKRAIGNSNISKIFIDGGFANNQLFTNMLADKLPTYKLRKTKSPLGSALGAAMVVNRPNLKGKFLKKHYAMKKVIAPSQNR